MKHNDMKEFILQQGIVLISRKGFKNTGISEILQSASIPKGSFYYYFESKKDFGHQMVNYAAQSFFDSINTSFAEEIPPLQKIELFFDRQIEHFRGNPCSCNCLFGKLSQEITEEDPQFRNELAEIFRKWNSYLCRTLIEAEKEGTIILNSSPEALSRFILSGWEGALMQGKVLQSISPLIEFREILLKLL